MKLQNYEVYYIGHKGIHTSLTCMWQAQWT